MNLNVIVANAWAVDVDTGTQANDLLFLTPIEIRVYP